MVEKLTNDKDILYDLIVVQQKSYEELGRMYGCSGVYIKRIAKKLGIPLKQRREINPSETFNKKSTKVCVFCGKPLIGKAHSSKYCNRQCMFNHRFEQLLNRYNSGENVSVMNTIPDSLKNYLLEQQEYKCSRCGFEGYNPKTGNTILQVHHKDGNSQNNTKDNIEIICPNCHAMTDTFMALNIGNATRVKYKA